LAPNNRKIDRILTGVPTTDGAGVRLTRIIGSPELNMLDPFLLLDVFESDDPDDYIAGFPAHPHRGFETVTYMFAGRLEHQDSVGNQGVIETGGLQWMTAGKGIIHSEMPRQESGLLKGIQLWVNLPARLKMSEPAYREIKSADIPVDDSDSGVRVRVIAGTTDRGIAGPIADVVTEPVFIDVALDKTCEFRQSVPPGYNGFVFSVGGEVKVVANEPGDDAIVPAGHIATLDAGDRVHLMGCADVNRALLVAAKIIDEPVARGGPFVMNTKQEIIDAFGDYSRGTLAPDFVARTAR
jgi:redox-sensitive bicupin YhaK (pirin superfamily)